MSAAASPPKRTPRLSRLGLWPALVAPAAALGAFALVLLVTTRPSSATAAGFPACNRVDRRDTALVAEGKFLFSSRTAFNQTGPVPACALCPLPTNFYTDNLNHQPTPKGGALPPPARSTPSLSQALRFTAPYHWDGAFGCLQQQAFAAITGTVEIDGTVS